MYVIRIVSLFIICLTFSVRVAAQVDLVPTQWKEFGDLSELGTGLLRVFVQTENLESRGKILKELAKYSRLEVVGRMEDADFLLVYGSTLVGTSQNSLGNDFAQHGGITTVSNGDMVAFRLVDHPNGGDALDGRRTRVLWYAHKRQTILRTDQVFNTIPFGQSGSKSSFISPLVKTAVSVFARALGLPIGRSPEVKATRAFIKELKNAYEQQVKLNPMSPFPSPVGDTLATRSSRPGVTGAPQQELQLSVETQKDYRTAFRTSKASRTKAKLRVTRSRARARRQNYLRSVRGNSAGRKAKRTTRTLTPKLSRRSSP